MKLKLLICLFIPAFFLLIPYSYSQQRDLRSYRAGFGLRGGFLYGVSIKGFLNANSALEGIVGTRWQGYSFTGLYEYQRPTKFLEGMAWFFGFGAHAGTYEERYFLENAGGKPNSTTIVYAIGIDGIIGLEYHVIKVPFSFGIDFKPFLDLVNSNQNYLDAALTIRYVFD